MIFKQINYNKFIFKNLNRGVKNYINMFNRNKLALMFNNPLDLSIPYINVNLLKNKKMKIIFSWEITYLFFLVV